MKGKIISLLAAAVLVLALSSVANADTTSTLYCTGGNTCYGSNSGLTSYWTLQSTITLGTDVNGPDFTYTLTVSATNVSSPGYAQDFSGQYFFGGNQLTNLAWVTGENPGGWYTPQPDKGGNSGTCQGNSPGAFCGAEQVDLGKGTKVNQGIFVPLGSAPVTFGVTGNYDGTFLENGLWNFQFSAALNSNGSGGNVLAISTPVGPDGPVPEPGTLALFGTGLITAAGFLRRKLFS